VEARPDGSEVIPGRQSGPPGSGLAAAVDASAFLAELARAVDRDLSTPDHAPATERAYAHDWDDFAAFCGRHALAPYRRRHRRWRFTSKRSRPAAAARPRASAPGPSAFPSRRCAGGWPRSQAAMRPRGSRPRRTIRWCAGCCGVTAAVAEPRRRRRSRSSSSGSRRC